MTKQDANEQPSSLNHLNRSLSMVIHHEEVQTMARAIERILASQQQATDAPEEE